MIKACLAAQFFYKPDMPDVLPLIGIMIDAEKTHYWKHWNETWTYVNFISFLQDAGVTQLCETKASATGRHGGFGQIPV